MQMVSQPAWYAVMALPYLMEYPYECSEQTFNRLYANAAGAAHRQLAIRRSAASSTNGRARRRSIARWRRTRT